MTGLEFEATTSLRNSSGCANHFPFAILHFSFVIAGIAVPLRRQMKNVVWRMANENASKSSPDRLFTRGDAAHFQSLHIGVGHFPFDLSDRLAGGVEPGIADALVVDVDQRAD